MNNNWLNTYDQVGARGLWLPGPWPSRLVVSGDDAKRFLQNFCTNVVLQAPIGSAIEAFFLNTKGHVLHHGLLVVGESQVVIYLVGSSAESLQEHLDRYVIREKVAFELRQSPWWLALGGARGDVERILPNSQVHPFPLLHCPASIVESDVSADHLRESLKAADVWPPEWETSSGLVFEALRIESGLPLPEVDYPAGTLPQELARDSQALHFEKGCYLGQETVARLDALGHVNKLLRGIRFAGVTPSAPGVALSREGKDVGKVTSLSYSPRSGSGFGLAIVRREAAAVGTELAWSGGTATVEELPLPHASQGQD